MAFTYAGSSKPPKKCTRESEKKGKNIMISIVSVHLQSCRLYGNNTLAMPTLQWSQQFSRCHIIRTDSYGPRFSTKRHRVMSCTINQTLRAKVLTVKIAQVPYSCSFWTYVLILSAHILCTCATVKTWHATKKQEERTLCWKPLHKVTCGQTVLTVLLH